MKNKLLFKRFSQCCFPSENEPLTNSFSVWSDGSLYYEYKEYKNPEEAEIELLVKLIKHKKIKTEHKLILKSSRLAEEVKAILNKYQNEISFLETNPTLVNRWVADGYTDFIQFENKVIWGHNILTFLPYKKEEDISSLSEEQKKNDYTLAMLSKIYLEIENAINYFASTQISAK